jgi:hypothetical protein
MKWMFVFLILGIPSSLNAESRYSLKKQERDSLNRMIRFERGAYRLLFSWSTKSMVYGGIVAAAGRQEYGIVHATFGAVNTGIALYGLYDIRQWDGRNPYERYDRLVLAARTNTFIDVGYIAAGSWLYQNRESHRRQEVGKAILIQGGWLFLFDAYLWGRGRSLLNKQGFYISPASQGTGIRIEWK